LLDPRDKPEDDRLSFSQDEHWQIFRGSIVPPVTAVILQARYAGSVTIKGTRAGPAGSVAANTEEIAMASEPASRPETMAQIIRLARFAILCTLGLAAVLLLADMAGRGWSTTELRFLSEKVVVTLVYGIAAQAVGAIAAVTCVALWK
jgi:hypothetical protein